MTNKATSKLIEQIFSALADIKVLTNVNIDENEPRQQINELLDSIVGNILIIMKND